MHYIIQENVFREQNYNKLLETIQKMGFDHTVVRVFPFSDKIVDVTLIPDEEYVLDDLPDISLDTDNVFCFGSLKIARISKLRGWKPGSLMNENNDYEVYCQYYKENLLNYDSEIKHFGDKIDFSGQRFIRPTEDTKSFKSGLYYSKEWEDYVYENLNNGHTTVLTKDTRIQVSTPKIIYKEIRCWVVDGRVIAASIYKQGAHVIYQEYNDPEGIEYAQSMVDIFQLASSFVIDICLTNVGWKIVECGCINCAGFYDLNMQKFIGILNDFYEINN